MSWDLDFCKIQTKYPLRPLGLRACRVFSNQRSTSSLLTQGEVYLSPFPLGPSGSDNRNWVSQFPPTPPGMSFWQLPEPLFPFWHQKVCPKGPQATPLEPQALQSATPWTPKCLHTPPQNLSGWSRGLRRASQGRFQDAPNAQNSIKTHGFSTFSRLPVDDTSRAKDGPKSPKSCSKTSPRTP